MRRAIANVMTAGMMAMFISSGAFANHTLRHQQETDPYGTPAPERSASRVIKLQSDAKAMRVTRRETATVTKDGKSFTWNFFTFSTATFYLKDIAPKDFNAGEIRVYVDMAPEDISGG